MIARLVVVAAGLALVLACPAAAGSWRRLPSEPLPADTAVERGHIAFESRCAICHGGEADAAGTNSLTVKYAGSKPARLERRTDLTPAVVRYYVRHGSGMMPFFPRSEVSDAMLDDIGAYLSRKDRR
jgi:(+)-pinoresinol hydroxylase